MNKERVQQKEKVKSIRVREKNMIEEKKEGNKSVREKKKSESIENPESLKESDEEERSLKNNYNFGKIWISSIVRERKWLCDFERKKRVYRNNSEKEKQNKKKEKMKNSKVINRNRR